ncbi:MAG TPA: cytochrome c [Candidatus Sulfotelmatobacter sp.]|nr:cytochrome c [Candidatus Sulfotelmatobacter sp.]
MKKLLVSLLMATALLSDANAQKPPAITPVTGESWLNHLHRALEQSSMGNTGRLGPATIVLGQLAAENASFQRLGTESGEQSVTLQGADLYRLNCRGCHGEFGLGAPPEINSVIGATRATSAPLIVARMKERGLDTSREQANDLANQAKATLMERLHKGGIEMPPFPHLREPEIRAIFIYLRLLAEIPGAETQQVRVEEEPVRIGEHIVKSTCHVCHNALGVNPTGDELLQGAIPPLSSLTTRVSLSGFERKVRHGAPIMMGTPLEPYRGRMPVFDYLSESEVADAYLYLKLYPPSAWSDPVNPPNPTQSASAIAAIVSTHEPPNVAPRSETAEIKAWILPVLAEIFVGLLVVGGAVFTLYDVKRSKPQVRVRENAATSLSLVSTQAGVVPLRSGGDLSGISTSTLQDAHKQAAWRSRFDLSEYHSFESSWLSRRLEKEDGVA